MNSRFAPAGPPSDTMREISWRSAAFSLDGSSSSRRFTRFRAPSRSEVAVFTPMSAVKRISSISASVDSSTWREPPKIPWSRAMKPPRVFSRPAASVRPASASARRRFSSSIRRRASSASRASRAASSRATRSASSRSSRRRSLSSRSASFFCRYSSFLRVSSATATASRRATSAGAGVGAGAGRTSGAGGGSAGSGTGSTPASRSSCRSISACGTGGSTGAAPRFRNMRRPATTKSATSAATTAAPTRSEVAKASGMGSKWILRKRGKVPGKRDHIGPAPGWCQRAAGGGPNP